MSTVPTDQTRGAQHLEVMRHGGLRKIEQWDELADADLPGVLAQHVDELHADRVPEGFGDLRHPQRLLTVDIGIDHRLATRLPWLPLGLRGQFQIDRHLYTYID